MDKLIDIRKRSFSEKIPLSTRLLEIVRGVVSHSFLQNPASQNTYLYLCEYVKNLSEYWFKKSLKDIKILDWGCGKGHITFFLTDLGAKVTSCDITSGIADSSFFQDAPILSVENYPVVPLEHDYLLPFGDSEFDVVVSFGVLEHVKNDNESMMEINRVLVDSGLFLCFNLPNSHSWIHKYANSSGCHYHDRFYDKNIVKSLCEESGFEILDIWHRQLFPKNSVKYPNYRLFERIDQFLCDFSPLGKIATNIEFAATKKKHVNG